MNGRPTLSVFYSILLHGVLAVFLVVSIGSAKPVQPGTHKLAIEAVVVDQADMEEEIQRLDKLDREREAVDRKRKEDAKKEQQRLDALKVQREKREVEAADREAKAEKRRIALEKQAKEKQAEIDRLAEQKKRQEADAAEAEEKLRVQREKREAEEAKAAKAKREREAEEQRLAELERKKMEAAEQRRKEEQAREQAAREDELLAALQQEQDVMNARESGDMDKYALLIQNHIENNWIRPPNARAGLNCELRVKQIPGGDVIGVEIGTCNADPATLRTIEAAVYRSSPLPTPPNSIVFDRNLRIIFAPDE